jgi:hypothetical protein
VFPFAGRLAGDEAYTVRKQAVRIELRNWVFVAKADSVGMLEGSIWSSVHARTAGVAGVRDRGTLSKGSPGNPGELTISSDICALVPRISNRTGSVRQEGRAHRSEYILTEVSRCQGKPEATVIDRSAVLRTHSTCEGGEPQGFQRWKRPGHPLEGRGEQMDGAMQ